MYEDLFSVQEFSETVPNLKSKSQKPKRQSKRAAGITASDCAAQTPLRAIDLYSGIGGWALGLKLAGIQTLAAYEWWDQANKTYQHNFNLRPNEIDIRELRLEDLPHDVDVVVGSPPCTEFSFSNRGGSGDIQDGLKDVRKFLEIVRHVRPRYWAMENVPRVAGILEKELSLAGSLHEFAPLVKVIEVVDMSEFGLPQSRGRMIAGDFPAELLRAYPKVLPRRTLGHVVESLQQSSVLDPVYGFRIARKDLTETDLEPSLTPEEERMNREAKQYHPVYNIMSFPDRMDEPCRTVTATCTRVSRESVVIVDERTQHAFRRLNLRERASLQGFPITFQFYGRSYGAKLKMAGNAIPPLMAFYVGQAMLSKPPNELATLGANYRHPLPTEQAPRTVPDGTPRQFTRTRRFRAAIKGLRFGSGMRFELVNRFESERVGWQVDFYYGPSKDIRRISLDSHLLSRLRAGRVPGLHTSIQEITESIKRLTPAVDALQLQEVWTKQRTGTGPFQVADWLGQLATATAEKLTNGKSERALELVLAEMNGNVDRREGKAKIERNAGAIWSGFIIGACFNTASQLAFGRERRTGGVIGNRRNALAPERL